MTRKGYVRDPIVVKPVEEALNLSDERQADLLRRINRRAPNVTIAGLDVTITESGKNKILALLRPDAVVGRLTAESIVQWQRPASAPVQE